jgi:hypothetical protein
MTAAAPQPIRLCKCGHMERRHVPSPDTDNWCGAADCDCPRFELGEEVTPAPHRVAAPAAEVPERINVPVQEQPASPHRVVVIDGRRELMGQPGPSLADLIAAGRRSSLKRTVTLADRIVEMAQDLAARLRLEQAAAEKAAADHAAAEAARREIADLEARLAAARAKLKGSTPAPDGGGDGSKRRYRVQQKPHPCLADGCPTVAKSKAGLESHRRSAHPVEVAS